MRRQKWKRKAALALTVIMAGTAAGGIHQVNAAKKTVVGTYEKLVVSATNNLSTVLVYNQSRFDRYVYINEIVYDKNNKIVRNKYDHGIIEKRGQFAINLPLKGVKGVKKVRGIGQIFRGTTGKLTLLETKRATVQP